MAKNIGYLIQPNATPTAAEAPYLVRIVPTGVANDADIVADIAQDLPVTGARYATIWREAIARAIPRLKAGETVDLGCLRLVPHIEKAMACEDSAFDPEVNSLVVAVYLIGELAEATAGLVPTKVSSAALASLVKVSNVMDVATETFGEIHGTDEFAILGNGVTLDGEDEYVKALDAKTGEEIAAATVVRVSKGQRGYAKFASSLPAGRVTVEIGTHGLVADEQLHVFKKTVTAIAAKTPPGPTPIAQSKSGDIKIFEIGPMRTDAAVGTIKGVNVGLDGEPPNGILNVTCVIGGKTVDWACSGTGGFADTEVPLVLTTPTGNLPAPGEYTVTLDCHRVNGYDETEEIAIPDVKVVIG